MWILYVYVHICIYVCITVKKNIGTEWVEGAKLSIFWHYKHMHTHSPLFSLINQFFHISSKGDCSMLMKSIESVHFFITKEPKWGHIYASVCFWKTFFIRDDLILRELASQLHSILSNSSPILATKPISNWLLYPLQSSAYLKPWSEILTAIKIFLLLEIRVSIFWVLLME